MCGISGIIEKEGAAIDPRLLERMALEMATRGPDAQGIFVNRNRALIHRRLKVLDLSDEANQPFFSGDRKISLVFNGEIYNFKDLKSELAKQGYEFKTTSDTEVALRAFEHWGVQSFERFNGMFSLAFLDEREQKPRLYLVRDRFGIKPLFYSVRDGRIAFASVLRPLFRVPWIEKDLDSKSLFQFLQFSHVHGSDSMLSAVKQLSPGQYLLFKDGKPDLKEYWRPNLNISQSAPNFSASREESHYLEEFETIFKRVITRQTVADVPLGCFLSGGIDSSLIAFMMGQVSSKKLKTYSVGYSEQEFDEVPYAEKVAELLGTEHQSLRISESDCMELIEQVPIFFDQPMADPTLLSSLLLSRLARQDVTVALSGDGADELFFGYPYQVWIRSILKWSGVPDSLRRGIFRTAETLLGCRFWAQGNSRLQQGRKLAQILQFRSESELFQYFIGMVGPLPIPRLKRLLVQPVSFQSPLDSLLRDLSSARKEDQIIEIFQRTFLPDTVLAKSDRAGMAYGLEVRVPFLDNELVDFSSRLPFHLKYRQGITKVLLRKSLRGKLPKSIASRKKQGFSIPMREWLRGEMRPLVDRYLNESRLSKEGIFAPLEVNQLVVEHLERRANHSHLLWALICFQLWKEKYNL